MKSILKHVTVSFSLAAALGIAMVPFSTFQAEARGPSAGGNTGNSPGGGRLRRRAIIPQPGKDNTAEGALRNAISKRQAEALQSGRVPSLNSDKPLSPGQTLTPEQVRDTLLPYSSGKKTDALLEAANKDTTGTLTKIAMAVKNGKIQGEQHREFVREAVDFLVNTKNINSRALLHGSAQKLDQGTTTEMQDMMYLAKLKEIASRAFNSSVWSSEAQANFFGLLKEYNANAGSNKKTSITIALHNREGLKTKKARTERKEEVIKCRYGSGGLAGVARGSVGI